MTTGLNFYAGSSASVQSLIARSNACILYQVQAQNLSGADRYVQIFDVNSLPANGSAPMYSYLIPDRNLIAIQLPGFPPDIGRKFSTGAFVVWSSTANTLTLAAASGTLYANGRDAA
jgi:hypothetical protein